MLDVPLKISCMMPTGQNLTYAEERAQTICPHLWTLFTVDSWAVYSFKVKKRERERDRWADKSRSAL